MDSKIADRLLKLNRDFYSQVAAPFVQSRNHPQTGYPRLLAHLPEVCDTALDVGCGEGRFGRFLHEHLELVSYVGVDFTSELLTAARETTSGEFVQRDISRPGFLDGLGQFDLIACLSTMQHIPGHDGRVALLQEMRRHLTGNGRIILINWQFANSPRQRRKIQPWETVGLTQADVEPNDYLLTWQRGGLAYRYVALIDEQETEILAQKTGCTIHQQFRSDGKEGNLNLYTVLG